MPPDLAGADWPRRLPPAVVARLNQLRDPDSKHRYLLRTLLVVSGDSYRGASRTLRLHDASAVRKRVQSLERMLSRAAGHRGGIILVKSDGSGHLLTDLGLAVVEHVRDAFAAVEMA